MSAPMANGFWFMGLAKVLSMATLTPRSWAPFATASTSTNFSKGLVGLSNQMSFVLLSTADRMSSVRTDGTKAVSIPNRGSSFLNRLNVPP